MQAKYRYEVDSETDVKDLKKLLNDNLQQTVDLYYLLLLYVKRIAEYAEDYSANRAAKHLSTAEDLNVSTRIATNPFIEFLHNDPGFRSFVEKKKLHNYVDSELVKKLFHKLVDKKRYVVYTVKEEPSLEDHTGILAYLLRKVMLENEDLEQHLEEFFINVADDVDMLNFIAQKSIEAYTEKNAGQFFDWLDKRGEDITFAHELLEQTVKHSKEFEELIEPKLVKWEMDRVAVIDVIIMKMAVCELMYFETIPVKVTINEYVDIAKHYSTPKSKDFVNGVIDKLMHQLKEEGKIKKKGRGLVEY